MNRLTARELAELEASIDAFPTFRAMEFASRLREAYAEIDRLNSVIREWERDMKGTVATLEVERAKSAKLLAACQLVVDRWERGDLAEAARACAEAVAIASGRAA